MEVNTRDLIPQSSEVLADEMELTLEEASKHPILDRVAKRVASDVRTTSHSAHNSHYSSNT
jgi:hypothetical protein